MPARKKNRIRRLKKKDQADRRKAKKVHSALLSGDTLYDALVEWSKQNLSPSEADTILRLLKTGSRRPTRVATLNRNSVESLRKLGLVAKLGDLCILAKGESISKCIGGKEATVYKPA
jgi:hypothetical protein